MDAKYLLRGLLSFCLAVTLLFSLVPMRIWAEELAETTGQTTDIPPEPDAAEETRDTEPARQEPAPEQPQTTIPTTSVMEQPTQMTIRYVAGLPVGTENAAFQGILTYAGYGVTVIQDDTAGICLTLPEGTRAEPGEILEIVGTRGPKGVIVTGLTRKGTAELPEREAALDTAEECVRVVIREADFANGALTQGSKTVPLFPSAPEGVAPGDKLSVWGVLVDGFFYADTIRRTENAPAETSPSQPQLEILVSPADAVLETGENIGLFCMEPDTTIYYRISYDGITYGEYTPYSTGIQTDPEEAHVFIQAYARKEGFRPGEVQTFRFVREATKTEADSPAEPEQSQSGAPNVYFGRLHTHTAQSVGEGTAAEAYESARAQGMDFFAVTDQSQFLDTAIWNAGKEAAKSAAAPDFVGIYGYEIIWRDPALGHMSTFNTSGWYGADTREEYCRLLTAQSGSVSQFNHPGEASDFTGLYSPRYDARISLLELGSGRDPMNCAFYTRALDAGWHVAPTSGQSGAAWTAVLASALTENALYQAMENRRVYTTMDSDLKISYTLNGADMGSVIRTPAEWIRVRLWDPQGTADCAVEVVTVGGSVLGPYPARRDGTIPEIPVSDVESPYYYLRILRSGTVVAVTAPVWVDTELDVQARWIGDSSPTPTQGQTAELTLEVSNQEPEAFRVDSVQWFVNGMQTNENAPETAYPEIPGFGTQPYSFSLQYSGLGQVDVQAIVSGTIYGEKKKIEASTSVTYQPDAKDISLSGIRAVRNGTENQVYRIQGFVTAGTSNRRTTFPGEIYLQDDTGGIAVSAFWQEGIQIGTPLEITGYLKRKDGNPTLVCLDQTQPESRSYCCEPRILTLRASQDYDTYGGQLIQTEGTVDALTGMPDGLGISSFTLKDIRGDRVTVRIDSAIRSASTGENRLAAQVKYGRTVRAIGLLHLDEKGEPFLRVRNCEEVVQVEPLADYSNPKTGSARSPAGAVLAASAAGLLWVYLPRKKRR